VNYRRGDVLLAGLYIVVVVQTFILLPALVAKLGAPLL
jgi:hypothetical protein